MTEKLIWICLGIFLSVRISACGPWIPESYVLRNDELFYAPPETGFAAELRYLLPADINERAVLSRRDAGGPETILTLQTELRELQIPGEEKDALLAEYRRIRGLLNDIKNRGPGLKDEDKNALENLSIPQGIPEEFRLYLEGARAFYLKNMEKAAIHWEAVLALPENQRRHQSVASAYMLARSSGEYELVRRLAHAGFDDPLGLAAASYGWEAQRELHFGDKTKAIDGYLKQWATGYGNAPQSLEAAAKAVFIDPTEETFQSLVAKPESRAVLTAYVLTRRENENTRRYRDRLLQALPGAGELTVRDAGRFALLEYQQNQLDSARAWLDRADPKDALALWVRGKLLLRDGKIDEGRILIETLTQLMSVQGEDWRRLDTRRAWVELGLLYLREARFAKAAEAFRAAESWPDCAYVLERLLTVDDSVAWVQNMGLPKVQTMGYKILNPRDLVARRLMRAGRFEEAMKFFGKENLKAAQKYVMSLKKAEDVMLDATLRARHTWTAARVMRDQGMEIFGTELSPDYTWFGGRFQLEDLFKMRKAQQERGVPLINRATQKEIERGRDSAVKPEKRFHYRYLAADLAEQAADFLPKDDPDAARIYCIAGGWLKIRDPEAADRFFKLLVLRCPNTYLGKVANEINWFPNLEIIPEPFSGK